MNISLAKTLNAADGRYLFDLELQALEQYVATYESRLKVYSFLQTQGDSLILTTLRRMMTAHRQAIQQHGEVCRRDMAYVLRYAAASMLKDDLSGWMEGLVLWMQNIMASLKKEQLSAEAYKILQEVIRESLPASEAALINEYLELFVKAMQSNS